MKLRDDRQWKHQSDGKIGYEFHKGTVDLVIILATKEEILNNVFINKKDISLVREKLCKVRLNTRY